MAHLILADNKLLLLKVDGTLMLVQPDVNRFRKLAEADVSPNITRALAAGKFYFRDNQQDSGSIYCLKIGR